MLHLDVDLYDSYRVALNNLYPFVARGGIIAFDEYKNPTKYVGARQAIDEFLENKAEKPTRGKKWDRYYVVKE